MYKKSYISGVTDSKAVTGSKSGFDFGGSAGSIVVIVTGVLAGIVFTVLLVCLFVTCRRKVRLGFKGPKQRNPSIIIERA